MSRHLIEWAAVGMIMMTFMGVGWTADGKRAGEDAGPLVLTGENTVILNRDVYAGRWLQYYLIKCVAKHPDAMKYAPGPKEGDRFASPVFPFVNEKEIPPGKNLLVVGPIGRLKEPYLNEADRKKLDEKDGSILVRRRGHVVVMARSGVNPWNLNHIRVFLDKCAGVRLYAPTDPDPSEEELWLSMPNENAITIGKLDIFMKPFFAKTTFSSGGYKRNKEWLRMNCMVSEGLNLRASHTISSYFKPEKYYDTHPEIYPMTADGKRPRPTGTAWNPCLANPELLAKITMDEIRERMKSKRRPSYLSFGVMDYPFDCHCPVCQASAKKYNGSYSNLYYAYMNKVAKQCRKEFPKLYLTAYLYANVRRAPVDMTIEPNIVVDVVTKSYNWIDPQSLQYEKDRIKSISDLGASWITHDWNFSGVTPRIYSRQWAVFLQWAAVNGMKGIYTEWSGGEAWYLDGAKYWVQRQLLSNPYQDVDGLWRQYCTDMYGAASEEMYRFYGMFAQKHVYSKKYYRRRDLPRREMAGFTREDLALQRGWLEKAVKITRDDPMIRKRLAVVMRYFRGHELFATAVGEPARAYHRYTTLGGKTGINQEALAFYVNDDGKALLEAIDYYETKRTIAPDSHEVNKNLGAPLSYRANYSRALGTIIRAVRDEAMKGVDLGALTHRTMKNMGARARKIYRENLPKRFNRKRAREIEGLVVKTLWIPRGKELPKFDGDLSDAAWRGAAELTDFTLADLILPTREGNETTGKIMRVGDLLVLGVVCRQPNGIWAETPPDVRTGTRIWRESCSEFFFGPQPKEGEKPVYFQYIVNSLGAFRGFQVAKDNREHVRCAAKIAPDGKTYTIEVALPLKTEKYDFTQGKAFNFTIMRQAYYSDSSAPPERLGWHPMFFTAHNVESRGLVFME